MEIQRNKSIRLLKMNKWKNYYFTNSRQKYRFEILPGSSQNVSAICVSLIFILLYTFVSEIKYYMNNLAKLSKNYNYRFSTFRQWYIFTYENYLFWITTFITLRKKIFLEEKKIKMYQYLLRAFLPISPKRGFTKNIINYV